MRKKQRTAVVTASIAVGALLAGCSGGGGGDGGGGGEITEINVPTVEAPWIDGYRKIIADYEEESGVKVNLTAFPFDGLLTQEANAAQNGSNAFDVMLLNEQWVGLFYDNEWVQPLADVDPEFEWDENLIEFAGVGRWDAENRSTSSDGVPYSLPMNGNIHLFMYRTDLYDELGLEIPETWDQVVENGEAAIESGEVEHGYIVRGKTPSYDFSALLFTHGGTWFADEASGDYTPAINSPEGIAALEQFKELADLGPDAPQTIAQAETISLMQGGSALQTTLVTANAVPLEDTNASLVAGNIGYAVLPGKTPVSGTWTLGIPAGLPDDRAQAGYDFITWLTSKEAQQQWAEYGGVTVRSDIETDRPELQAVVESADLIHGGLRYAFTPAMLDVTDPIIGEYLAGGMSAEEAAVQMEEGLLKVVEEAGYLK